MPRPTRTFGYWSLEHWWRAGCRAVEIHCTAPGCGHAAEVPLADLLRQVGHQASFVAIARAARCRRCRRRGCHAQPGELPGEGDPGYEDWLAQEVERCETFLRRAGRLSPEG
ncbi:hypothetical protein [Azospirillum thermophilum]|uniref:hypothetical protein n=1 Tax=Azospirillum thermophilum TaxID=2202148 RepID=UPI0011B604D4|nr:hypothetical protein [Azospirillum thermophilum]